MLQLRDIPTGENSQGDKSLNLLSYLKTVSISLKKFGLKSLSLGLKNLVSKKSLGIGLKKFGLKKKSWYQSRKHLVSKKSLGIGLEDIWSRKKVSVSVSKILVSKKSLGIGLDEIFWSRHSVLLLQYLASHNEQRSLQKIVIRLNSYWNSTFVIVKTWLRNWKLEESHKWQVNVICVLIEQKLFGRHDHGKKKVEYVYPKWA